MRLCFLVEEQYRHDGMPNEVIGQLTAWGHHVDVVRPGGSLLRMTEAVRTGTHDAWVLKTVSGGPGLTLLEAAAGAGMTTVNDARAIRGVRDKALAAALGSSRGLPLPPTYAVARPELLLEIPDAEYPLVVKPADGSSGRAVYLVSSPDRLAAMLPELAGEGMLIAQPYVPNAGTDIKVYSVCGELYATERRSPLHPDHSVRERRVPLSAEVAAIAGQVGAVYGLDLYGVDVILGPDGPVVVDVNDFPSFRQVPDAAARVARAVLGLARAGAPGSAGAGTGLRSPSIPAQVGAAGASSVAGASSANGAGAPSARSAPASVPTAVPAGEAL